MKPILEIHSVSKKYRIQHQATGYLSLRERMVSAFKFEKNNSEDFWALNNVSFEVQPGESVGIIGRNGAGKSTLLKILSMITPPTSGKIVSRGRIASLLEVGTGFHPELTGRENIFFNGSLLGMKRREIDAKFHEIVDFSGVEKFLDTPLKHFSSGMQLRLAFAVAAFLEPEILIIDEVLAVGDAEFQKKCLGKMEDVAGQGRTILFVSHNLSALKSLCKRGIVLESGTKISDDSINKAIEDYNRTLQKFKSTNSITWSKDKQAAIDQIELHNTSKSDQLGFSIDAGDHWKLTFSLRLNAPYKHFIAALGIVTIEGVPVRTIFSEPMHLQEGLYQIEILHNDIFLAATTYKLIIGLSSREQGILTIDEGLYLNVSEVHDKSVFVRSNAKNGIVINKGKITVVQCAE